MAKKTIEVSHKDLLGRNLSVGDFVVASTHGNNLGVYSITRLTPRMVRVKKLKKSYDRPLYPEQVVKLIDEKELTMLLLKEEI